MYQVILVDDEYYVRKSIQNRVNWAGLECVIAAEAENGAQALELVGGINPDIVLVDIMMPEMDGLELIRQAREISPGTQFAILSGYDDFLYTKEAIKLQVTDYIKKPVDVEELEAAVRAMIRTIEANRQARERLDELAGQAQDLTGMKIERALNDACAGAEAWRALEGLLQDGLHAWVLLFIPPRQTNNPQNSLERLKTEIEHSLRSSTAGRAYAAASDADANEIRILLPASSTHAVEVAARGLEQGLRSQSGMLNDRRFYLAHSDAVALPGLYEQYGMALQVLKSKIFGGLPGLQKAGGLKAASQEEITAVFALLERAKSCVAAGQFNRLEVVLSQLFSEKLVTSVQVVEEALFSLYGLARESAGRCKTQLPEVYAQKMVGSHALLYFDSLRDLKEQVRDLLLAIFCEGSSVDDDEITTQVKKYIEEHFNETISLKSIAGLFFLNPSYLSSLFKRKTGVNFNKYLEATRINHAKTLLANLDAPVNDIASMTGYGDPNYFTKAFKKCTGMTPSEYKEALKKGAG